jgi:molybdopterin adenylyltransferase
VDLLPVHIAVLTIGDDGADAARAIADRATATGHRVVDEETAKDTEAAIRDQLVRWIAAPNVDVVIVAASVDSEAASAALAPLAMQTLPGFTDLFRWLTFQEIGASAMLSAAEAAQCESTFVFVLPAHDAAVRAAMDKLILPQLDARTKPKNLVTQMPRLEHEAKRIATAMQAVPAPIAAEKTMGGSGVVPKPPARAKKPTANTIARKPDDPPTKEIDLAKLEKQIALSAQHEGQTKQTDVRAQGAQDAQDAKTRVVDMSAHQAKTRVADMTARGLPRVPPGADEDADDDDPLTFTAPHGTAPSTPAAATPLPSITKRAFGSSPPLSSRSTVATPPATPIVTPPTPIGIARREAITPVSPASAIAARTAVATPPAPLPPTPTPPAAAPIVIEAPRRPPTAPPPVPIKSTKPAPAEAEPAARESPNDAAPEVDAAESTDFDNVDAPLSAALTKPPVKRRPTQPPPSDPLAALTSNPLGMVDLPQGEFVYPIKRGSTGLVLKLLGGLVVLAIGFFAFVELYPRGEDKTQATGVTPEPAPIVAVAESIDAAQPAEVPAEDGDIEMEPASVDPPPASVEAPPASPASADTPKPERPARPSTRPTTRPSAGEQTGDTSAEMPDSKPAPSADPGCDEVSCVLAKYDRPCCERYRPKEAFRPNVGTPDELDKRMVKAGVQTIKPRVVACGEKVTATGTVKLAVSVDGEGAVKSVSVTESPHASLGECVAAAMRSAKFGKTKNGGEFVYPFVF